MRKIKTALHYPININELPRSWAIGYVGNFVVEIQPGFACGKHNQEGEGIPHLRPMNVDRSGNLDLTVVKYVDPQQDSKRLEADDVFFNNTNSPELIGKTAVITKSNGWGYSNHMTRLKFKKEINPRYAAYQLHYLWMVGYFLHNCVRHVNQASVSSKALAKSVPFLAAPLTQQNLIVAEIEKQFSRLDEAVENLQRVKANLKRYKASVLKAAVEGKLTEQWRAEHPDVEPANQLLGRILKERRKKWEENELAKMKAKGKIPKDDIWKKKYKEPKGPDLNKLPKLPQSWIWTRAEQVCDYITKGTTPKSTKLFNGSGDIPFLKVYNLTFGGSLDFSVKPTFISYETHRGELCRSRVYPGDVLMNIVGPPLGKVSIVPQRYPEWNMNQAIAVFRAMPGVDIKILSYFLMSETIQIWAKKRAKATAGQFNLTLEICRDLPIPIPPKEEQIAIKVEIEKTYSIAEKSNTFIKTNIKRAEALRQSILKKAFSGKLIKMENNHDSGQR